MTDDRTGLSRRAVLGAGLVLPVTFISGAQAAPLVQMAYEDQSDSGPGTSGGPVQPFPAENNPNVTTNDLGPATGSGALPANSALQQLQNLNSAPETPGQAYDNGKGPDDQYGPISQPMPAAPPTPEAAPVLPPAAPPVAADPQYQQLSTQYDQAASSAAAAAAQDQKAQAQWDAAKSNPSLSPDALTATYNNQQQAHNASVWAQYQAQQAKDAAQNRANQVIYTLQNNSGK